MSAELPVRDLRDPRAKRAALKSDPAITSSPLAPSSIRVPGLATMTSGPPLVSDPTVTASSSSALFSPTQDIDMRKLLQSRPPSLAADNTSHADYLATVGYGALASSYRIPKLPSSSCASIPVVSSATFGGIGRTKTSTNSEISKMSSNVPSFAACSNHSDSKLVPPRVTAIDKESLRAERLRLQLEIERDAMAPLKILDQKVPPRSHQKQKRDFKNESHSSSFSSHVSSTASQKSKSITVSTNSKLISLSAPKPSFPDFMSKNSKHLRTIPQTLETCVNLTSDLAQKVNVSKSKHDRLPDYKPVRKSSSSQIIDTDDLLPIKVSGKKLIQSRNSDPRYKLSSNDLSPPGSVRSSSKATTPVQHTAKSEHACSADSSLSLTKADHIAAEIAKINKTIDFLRKNSMKSASISSNLVPHGNFKESKQAKPIKVSTIKSCSSSDSGRKSDASYTKPKTIPIEPVPFPFELPNATNSLTDDILDSVKQLGSSVEDVSYELEPSKPSAASIRRLPAQTRADPRLSKYKNLSGSDKTVNLCNNVTSEFEMNIFDRYKQPARPDTIDSAAVCESYKPVINIKPKTFLFKSIPAGFSRQMSQIELTTTSTCENNSISHSPSIISSTYSVLNDISKPVSNAVKLNFVNSNTAKEPVKCVSSGHNPDSQQNATAACLMSNSLEYDSLAEQILSEHDNAETVDGRNATGDELNSIGRNVLGSRLVTSNEACFNVRVNDNQCADICDNADNETLLSSRSEQPENLTNNSTDHLATLSVADDVVSGLVKGELLIHDEVVDDDLKDSKETADAKFMSNDRHKWLGSMSPISDESDDMDSEFGGGDLQNLFNIEDLVEVDEFVVDDENEDEVGNVDGVDQSADCNRCDGDNEVQRTDELTNNRSLVKDDGTELVVTFSKASKTNASSEFDKNARTYALNSESASQSNTDVKMDFKTLNSDICNSQEINFASDTSLSYVMSACTTSIATASNSAGNIDLIPNASSEGQLAQPVLIPMMYPGGYIGYCAVPSSTLLAANQQLAANFPSSIQSSICGAFPSFPTSTSLGESYLSGAMGLPNNMSPSGIMPMGLLTPSAAWPGLMPFGIPGAMFGASGFSCPPQPAALPDSDRPPSIPPPPLPPANDFVVESLGKECVERESKSVDSESVAQTSSGPEKKSHSELVVQVPSSEASAQPSASTMSDISSNLGTLEEVVSNRAVSPTGSTISEQELVTRSEGSDSDEELIEQQLQGNVEFGPDPCRVGDDVEMVEEETNAPGAINVSEPSAIDMSVVQTNDPTKCALEQNKEPNHTITESTSQSITDKRSSLRKRHSIDSERRRKVHRSRSHRSRRSLSRARLSSSPKEARDRNQRSSTSLGGRKESEDLKERIAKLTKTTKLGGLAEEMEAAGDRAPVVKKAAAAEVSDSESSDDDGRSVGKEDDLSDGHISLSSEDLEEYAHSDLSATEAETDDCPEIKTSKNWIQSSHAKLFYKTVIVENTLLRQKTAKMDKLLVEANDCLVEKCLACKRSVPEFDPPPLNELLQKYQCNHSHHHHHHQPQRQKKAVSSESSSSDCDSSDEGEEVDNARWQLAQAEMKRKVDHPDRLHPDLWHNETAQMNDGPVCRCSWKSRQTGIRHGIYPGETEIPNCSPDTNGADRLHHYRVVVHPTKNLVLATSTTIKYDNHAYVFDGFSIFTHSKIPPKLPICRVVRYNIEYTITYVQEEFPENFCIRDLDLFWKYVFMELLELKDFNLMPTGVEKGCPMIHIMPRFTRNLEGHGKEILAMSEVFRYLLHHRSPLLGPQSEALTLEEAEWDNMVQYLRGQLVHNPIVKPSTIRLDQLDREPTPDSDGQDPLIVHFGVKPAMLTYAGNPEYQKAWKQYVKFRHLVANKPKVTTDDRTKLAQKETELQTLRAKATLKRDITIEVPCTGFYRTGLYSDVVQQALILPVLFQHLRFHWSLDVLQNDRLKYRFKSRSLLQLALTHPSFRTHYGMNPDHARNTLTNCGMRQPHYGDSRIHHSYTRKRGINTLIDIMARLGSRKARKSRIMNNERLEYLGDAVIEFLTSIHLYSMFPDDQEGSLASYRSTLVQNKHLALLAKRVGLDEFMLYAHGPDLCHEADLRHAMANCFEAVMAALYLDGGLDVADRVLAEALFPPDSDGTLLEVWNSLPKHPLQELEPDGDRHWIQNVDALKHLVELEKTTGLNFNHIRILARAFTRRNVGYNFLTLGHNQRLEFLGDTVLQLITSSYLYKHFPDHHEGHLSLLRSCLVNNKTQSVICDDLGLSDYVLRPEVYMSAEPKEKLRMKDKADLVESLIGAIYVDQGIDACKILCKVCFFPRLNYFIITQKWNDAKSQLQQCCLTLRSANGGEPDIPQYKVIQEKGPTNTRVYTVAVYFRGKRLATGEGHSVQQSEMCAAEAALRQCQDLFPHLERQKSIIEKRFRGMPIKYLKKRRRLNHRQRQALRAYHQRGPGPSNYDATRRGRDGSSVRRANHPSDSRAYHQSNDVSNENRSRLESGRNNPELKSDRNGDSLRDRENEDRHESRSRSTVSKDTGQNPDEKKDSQIRRADSHIENRENRRSMSRAAKSRDGRSRRSRERRSSSRRDSNRRRRHGSLDCSEYREKSRVNEQTDEGSRVYENTHADFIDDGIGARQGSHDNLARHHTTRERSAEIQEPFDERLGNYIAAPERNESFQHEYDACPPEEHFSEHAECVPQSDSCSANAGGRSSALSYHEDPELNSDSRISRSHDNQFGHNRQTASGSRYFRRENYVSKMSSHFRGNRGNYYRGNSRFGAHRGMVRHFDRENATTAEPRPHRTPSPSHPTTDEGSPAVDEFGSPTKPMDPLQAERCASQPNVGGGNWRNSRGGFENRRPFRYFRGGRGYPISPKRFPRRSGIEVDSSKNSENKNLEPSAGTDHPAQATTSQQLVSSGATKDSNGNRNFNNNWSNNRGSYNQRARYQNYSRGFGYRTTTRAAEFCNNNRGVKRQNETANDAATEEPTLPNKVLRIEPDRNETSDNKPDF